jgi:hypothetical protein
MRKRHRAAVLRGGVLTVVALMATGSAQTKGQLQIELLPGDGGELWKFWLRQRLPS